MTLDRYELDKKDSNECAFWLLRDMNSKEYFDIVSSVGPRLVEVQHSNDLQSSIGIAHIKLPSSIIPITVI